MDDLAAQLQRIECLLDNLDNSKPRREFLNIDEASNFIGVSRQTLDKWRMDGNGPAIHRVGRRVLYSIPDLMAFMEKHRIEPLT